jgi:hypothetical protein
MGIRLNFNKMILCDLIRVLIGEVSSGSMNSHASCSVRLNFVDEERKPIRCGAEAMVQLNEAANDGICLQQKMFTAEARYPFYLSRKIGGKKNHRKKEKTHLRSELHSL